MQNEYYVSVPRTFMYLLPDAKGEVTDELLYGTRVFSDTESYAGFVFCKTDYGYSGYVDSCDLSGNFLGIGEKYVVTSPFCDFHKCPDFRYAPVFTLPRGSVIFGKEEKCINEHLIGLEFEKGMCYLHKNNIRKYSDISTLADENEKRSQIVRRAFSYLGTPYRWSGKSTFGIDCSGLCFMSYTLCGLGLYRDAEFDRRYVKQIDFHDLKPCDLIYYNGHVTMYIGSNEYIHSSATLGGVKIGSFDEQSPKFYPRLATDIVCCARSLAFE